MKMLFAVLDRLSPALSYFLRSLSGGSFSLLLARTARLRRVASGMLAASPRPAMPVRLQIETTDVGNFKCIMCSREVIEGMNTKTMPLDEFTKLSRLRLVDQHLSL